MQALEAVLRPVTNILNRNIAAITPARELCDELSGTVIAIRIRDTAFATYFIVHDEALELVQATDREPDVVISGSLLTLARMTGSASEALIRDGSLDLSGDAESAQQFQRLLEFARPDIEEELSTVVGDVAAHRLGSVARGLARWSKDARATMAANIREYLQEESRTTPSRYEVDKFSGDVNTLRDDVDRLAARITRLQGDS